MTLKDDNSRARHYCDNVKNSTKNSNFEYISKSYCTLHKNLRINVMKPIAKNTFSLKRIKVGFVDRHTARQIDSNKRGRTPKMLFL